MLKILRKELKAFLKDRRAVVLTFLLPAILISIFALAFSGSDDNGVRQIPLLVSDEDHSALSKQTINDIDSVKMIEVIPMSYDSALDLIKNGKRSAVLVFHKGFSDSINAMKHLPWQLTYDAARAEETSVLQSLLGRTLYQSAGKVMIKNSIVNRIDAQFPGMDSSSRNFVMAQVSKGFSGGESGNNDKSPGKESKSTVGDLMKLDAEPVVAAKTGNIGVIQAVAGVAIMMLLFSLRGMGGGLLDEKDQGTLKRLLYSPIRPAEILLGKMAASLVVALMQLTVMFALAYFVFHLNLSGKLLPLSLVIFATAYACAGFGIFLACISRSRQQLEGIGTLVILTMSVIGGSMIPIFLMPQWMQNFSVISLNYWSIQAFYDVLWRQLPIGAVLLTKVGVLLAIGTGLTLIAFRFFRRNVLAIA